MAKVLVFRKKCDLCGICAKACPVKIIEILGDRVHINHEKCIHCFICAEACPKGAIMVFGDKLTDKLLHAIFRLISGLS